MKSNTNADWLKLASKGIRALRPGSLSSCAHKSAGAGHFLGKHFRAREEPLSSHLRLQSFSRFSVRKTTLGQERTGASDWNCSRRNARDVSTLYRSVPSVLPVSACALPGWFLFMRKADVICDLNLNLRLNRSCCFWLLTENITSLGIRSLGIRSLHRRSQVGIWEMILPKSPDLLCKLFGSNNSRLLERTS